MATSKTPAKKPTTTKKTTATKTVAKKPAVKKTVEKKAVKPAKKTSTKARNIGAEERYKMIEVAAYYIAERNHFKGSTLDYWIAAEAEISKSIGK
ncbi:MAG: DUF2934 domain-containing protein [Methylophilaceae bacterium]